MLSCNTIAVNDSTPTLIVDGSQFGEYIVHIEVDDDVIIGDSGVSTSNGFLLLRGTEVGDRQFTARIQGEDLYAVSVAATGNVNVLVYTT